MNLKLLTVLSVAIALVSAMTFVNLYQKSNRAEPTEPVVKTSQYSKPFAPSPDVTEDSASVQASVKIGNPGDVSASVTIL